MLIISKHTQSTLAHMVFLVNLVADFVFVSVVATAYTSVPYTSNYLKWDLISVLINLTTSRPINTHYDDHNFSVLFLSAFIEWS